MLESIGFAVVIFLLLYFLFKVYTSPAFNEARWSENTMREYLSHIRVRANEHIQEAANKFRETLDTADEFERVRTELNKLKIDKSKIEEEYAKKEREIEHKIGLERIRQKQEIELATREATLKVQESNLSKERDLFKTEMDFRNNRFLEEVKYQRELSEKLLKALPTMKMTRHEEIVKGED